MNKIENKCRRITLSEKYASFVLPTLLLFTDYFSIVSAEAIAYIIRKFLIPIPLQNFSIPLLYLLIVVPSIYLLFMHFADTYNRRSQFWEIAEKIFKATIYSILTIILIIYFGGVAGIISRLYVFILWILSFLIILSSRYFVKKYLNSKKILQVPVIFIGAGKTAELILKSFESDSGFSYKVIGIIDDHPVSRSMEKRFKLLGNFSEIEKIIKKTGIQTVIIAAPGLPSDKLVKMLNEIQLYIKNVIFVPDLMGAPIGNLELEKLFDEKIILLKIKNNLARKYNRIIKRIFDLTVSFLSLVILIPLGVLLSVLIYIDNPGPVVFSHTRIGKSGKEFPCYKFRTMVLGAEKILENHLAENEEAKKEWEKDFKLKNDPRITKVGFFLRKTSLDEFPQIINVIKGEMSLVGPRPIVKAEVEKYKECIYDYYLVPPGITGLWQVNGRSDTTYEERVQMDSWYVRNWSIWIDIVYIIKTFKVVIERKGAY